MRRVAPLIAIGLGMFLLVGGLVIRFYVHPQLAVAPIDQDSTTILTAPNATIFDSRPTVLAEIETDLTITSMTRGDVAASEEAGGKTLIWYNVTETRSADGISRSTAIDKTAHHAVTGMGVVCCDTYTEVEAGVQTPVDRTGLQFKFPFGTEKKTYPWWDADLQDTIPAEYVGTDSINGLDVYKFSAVVEKQKIGEREVPASVLGLDVEGNVTADEMYANERTFFVEPNTGAVVQRIEDTTSTYAYEGEDLLTATDATVQYTEQSVDDVIESLGNKPMLLGLVAGAVPWIISLVGLLLAVTGGFLARRDEHGAHADHDHRHPVGV